MEGEKGKRVGDTTKILSYLSSVDLSNGLHALMMSLAVYRASYARGESLGRYCAITMTHACIA